ncbi:MAG: hypothetical protein R2942_14165 [Ignavibacteria bacterium]
MYNSKGDMLYSGITNTGKRKELLMMNYGESRIILNKKKYDIFDLSYTPEGDIFYGGQTYVRKSFE